jgi:VanZ family protein
MDDFAGPLVRRKEGRLLAVVLILIVYGSLYPFSFTLPGTRILAWFWAPELEGVRDTVLNLTLYFPVGFLVWRTSRSRSRILMAMLVTLVVSAAMECLQSWDLGRVSSMPDLLLNIAGGVAGAWTAARARSQISASLGVILLAMLARTFPFFPNIHPHVSGFRADQAVLACVDWLAVWFALAVFLKRNAVTRELALLQLVVPVRVFLLDQATSWSDVAGALLALGVGHFWLNSRRVRPQQFAPVMLLSLIGRELLPFQFTAAARGFHWIPFETFLGGSPSSAVSFLSKFSLYGTALWLLDPEGRRLWRVAVGVAGLLFVLEWIQRYLPGRTPDISDSAIVLIAACALSALRTERTGCLAVAAADT